MSEYQYLHFAAVDQPLDDKQLAYMERQSSHCDVSRWEFSVEYHYSDFHGNTTEMMRRGYDVHLHYANFGIRTLAFRLPELPCDKKTFAAFEVAYGIEWKKDKRGKAGVLSFQPEADGGEYGDDYFDFNVISQSLPKLREMLIGGDLRPLYLAWLVCCEDEQTLEPPIPAGLGQRDRALETLAEFYEISTDLIAAAAEQSAPPPKKPDKNAIEKKWVEGLSKSELQQIARDLINGDATTVQAGVRSKLRKATRASPAAVSLAKDAKPSRTLQQIKEAEDSVQAGREKRENAARQRAKKKHLKSIAADPEKLVRQIDTLAAERSRESYFKINDCLTDMAEALGEESGPKKSRQIAQKLRQRKPRSNVLISVLRKGGWID